MMGMRFGRRWFSTLVVVTVAAMAAASCGGSGASNSAPGMPDASITGEMDGSNVFMSGDDGSTAPTCVPKTCTDLSYNCGMNGDGCGGTLDCGGCPTGQFCGGGGYSLCGVGNATVPDAGDAGQTNTCTQETCQSLNLD